MLTLESVPLCPSVTLVAHSDHYCSRRMSSGSFVQRHRMAKALGQVLASDLASPSVSVQGLASAEELGLASAEELGLAPGSAQPRPARLGYTIAATALSASSKLGFAGRR